MFQPIRCLSHRIALVLLLLFNSGALLAQDKPSLTIYTYDAFAASFGPGPKIKHAFEQQCGCQLNWVAMKDGGTLLNRVLMEGKHSQADLVLGLDNNLLAQARNSQLFAPLPASLQQARLSLPIRWQDDTFLPYDYGYFAFIYDKRRVKQPPTSLRELFYGAHPWRIIYQDPRTSTPGLALLLLMQNTFGPQTPAAWQQLAKKTVTVPPSWSEAYQLFLQGESDFVWSYTTSLAYQQMAQSSTDYAALIPTEGNYLQIEVVAQLAHSPHAALAQQFLQFMLTPAFQATIPTGNWMYPVTNIALPAAFNQLPQPQQVINLPAKSIAQSRQQWINTWLSAVSHR